MRKPDRKQGWVALFGSLLGSFLLAAPAAAVPDVLGLYEGTSTITLWGCSTPSDNKTTVGTGWIDITQQSGGSFSGTAEFSREVEGSLVTELLTISGTVFSDGSLSGSANSDGDVDGNASGSAQAGFTGTFAAHGIELQFPGGAVGIDGCQHSGAILFGNRCGNGNVEGSEECDDENRISEDGCSSMCLSEFCGDGIIQTGLGELCDDGNANPDDSCSNVCLLPEPDTTLFRLAGVCVLALLQRRRIATGRAA